LGNYRALYKREPSTLRKGPEIFPRSRKTIVLGMRRGTPRRSDRNQSFDEEIGKISGPLRAGIGVIAKYRWHL